MRAHMRRFLTASALGAAVSIGFLVAAATASAEPVPLPPPPDPAVVAPDQLTSLNTATITPPASDAPNQVAGGQLPVPANGVPHLASPDSPPPGSTMDPSVMGGDGPNVSYLKDLFHAVQNQEISGKEALLMGLAQRGMNTPYPDMAPGPNRPVAPGDLAAPAPAAPPLPAPALPSPPPPPAE